MAELHRQPDFEGSVSVKPIEGQPDSFNSVYRPWGWPLLNRIAGSIPLAEATAAAYKTVPAGFELHCLQAHFLRPGLIGVPLQHDVQRLLTSGSFACRHVLVKQGQGSEMETKTVLILSFIRKSLTAKGFAPEHEHTMAPSQDTVTAAAHAIKPEREESEATVQWNLPEGTSRPPMISQRLHISQEPDVNRRVLRVKFQTKSPLSGTAGQILAVVFMSDIFVMDAPLVANDIEYGTPKIGDTSKVFTNSQLKQMASLTHTLRFARFEGWDVHEGVLLESGTRWLKDRRGVCTITIRDARGELIATGEQEGYFVFKAADEVNGPDWMATSGGRAALSKI